MDFWRQIYCNCFSFGFVYAERERDRERQTDRERAVSYTHLDVYKRQPWNDSMNDK